MCTDIYIISSVTVDAHALEISEMCLWLRDQHRLIGGFNSRSTFALTSRGQISATTQAHFCRSHCNITTMDELPLPAAVKVLQLIASCEDAFAVARSCSRLSLAAKGMDATTGELDLQQVQAA